MGQKFRYSIGVDSGATNIRLALIRSDGKILHLFRGKSVITGIRRGIDNRMGIIADLYERLKSNQDFKSKEIFGVGIGISGQISTQGELIGHNGPRYPDISPINLKEKLINIFGNDNVFIENDSKAAALGEAFFGEGALASTMVHLTLGTGIGGGVIVDRKLVNGNIGLAGHLGFISVNKDGPRFISGMIGCVEEYASGTGIKKLGQLFAAENHQSLLFIYSKGDIENIDSPMVFEVASLGDETALKVLEVAATYLGMAIVTCLHAINPEIVTLGGGLAKRGELFLPQVRKTVNQLALQKYRNTPILIAKTGDDSGVLGAAALTGFVEG